MIIEIVSFDMPEGFGEAELRADARATVAHWQADPALIRKHFAIAGDGTVAGIYVWPDREAARRAHGPEWIARFRARTGREPRFAYFDVFMLIDNEAGAVREFPLPS
ncbi:MAG: hypothetical protein KatS3mg118_0445 [Paracoccaceae bacterium]|nr:MAG: hypothetical protein KatS3mg118_0445 [Paracoccaceae bacterium]